MRWLSACLVTFGLLAALAARAWAPAAPVLAQPDPSPTPEAQETPFVDPGEIPLPLYLPRLAQRDDRLAPPPLTVGARGFVAALNRRGREACDPATHALLAQPEGSVGNRAVAVLVQEGTEPALTLDLYIGEYVEVAGTDSTSAIDCWPVTERLIGVRRIRVVERPPGSASGRRRER